MTTKPRFNLISFLFDIVIDLALIAAGLALYFANKVYPLGFLGVNPLIVKIFGSQDLAVLIISGLLVFVGLFNLLRTILRLFKR